jgi:hypothetical protein
MILLNVQKCNWVDVFFTLGSDLELLQQISV